MTAYRFIRNRLESTRDFRSRVLQSLEEADDEWPCCIEDAVASVIDDACNSLDIKSEPSPGMWQVEVHPAARLN